MLNNCKKVTSVQFKTLLVSVQNQLGLSCIKWFRHEELDPYVLAILDYLNGKLILSGACTILQRLQEFTALYEEGTEQIINKETADLAYKVGLNTGDSEYREELFTLAWGIFMSSLYTQLTYNYAGIFDEVNKNHDCHDVCNECGTGASVDTSLGGTGVWQSSSYRGDCGCGNSY